MQDSAIRPRPTAFGVCPHDAATAKQAWRAFHERLDAYFSLRTTFANFEAFPPFEEALARLEFALAFLNPGHYAWMRDEHSYLAVARPSDPLEVARLITLRTRACRIVTGGIVACVDVHLTNAARRGLRSRGIDLTPHFVDSYAAVLEAVRQGDAEYGIVYGNYLEHPQTEEDAIQVVLAHQVHVPHVLAIHPTLASRVVEIRQFLLESSLAYSWAIDLNISNWESVPDAEYPASPRPPATIDEAALTTVG